MNMHRLALIVIVTAVPSLGCTSKIVVTRVMTAAGADKALMDGVYYSLPRTVVKIEQPVERTHAIAGRFRVYLPLFYPRIVEAKAFVDETQTRYTAKKPTFSTIGEPDPNQIYYVKLTGGGPIDRTTFLQFTEQGSVAGAEASADNATSDIALSVLSAVAGIASRSYGAADVPVRPPCGPSDTSVPCRIKCFKGPPSVDAPLLISNYEALGTTERVRIDDSAKNNKKLNFESALRAYAAIEDLKKNRKELRTKETALAVEAQLKDLDAEIASEMAYYFTGNEAKETWTGMFELRPRTIDDRFDLIRVNPEKGICITADLRGKDEPPKKFWLDPASMTCDQAKLTAAIGAELSGPAADRLTEEAKKAISQRLNAVPPLLADTKKLNVTFALDPPIQAFQQIDAAFKEACERSFRYILPATTKVSVSLGDTALAESRQQIAQFGLVASLPASTSGKSLNYALAFYESTGALKSFKLASKAVLQKATVDTLSTQATSMLDAKKKAEDELTALDHEQKVMAARKSIYDNCKALNLTCGGFTPSASTP